MKPLTEIEVLFLDLFKDSATASAAEDALAKIGEPAIEHLLRGLQNAGKVRDWKICCSIGRVFGMMDNQVGILPLLIALKSDDDFVQEGAIAGLAYIGEPVIGSLHDILTKALPHVRMAVCEALGRIANPGSVPFLIKALDDSYSRVTLRAANALGNIGDLRAVKPLANIVASVPSLADLYSEPLFKLYERQGREAFLEALKGEPANILNAVTKAMDRMAKKPKESVSVMRNNKDVQGLINVLEWHESMSLDAREAVKALGEIGDPCAVEPLIRVLDFKHPHMVDSAVRALGKLRDPRAVGPLISMLKKGTQIAYTTRSEIIWALGDIGDTRAVAPLTSTLKDKDKYIRRHAATALGGLGDKKAISSLRSLLKDKEVEVREAADAAIKQLPQ